MPLWSLVFAVAALSTVILTSLETQASQSADEGPAIAGNMCVLRNGLISFATSHPGVTGNVEPSSMTDLPTWFIPMDGVKAYIDTSGRPLVYLTKPAPNSLAYELRTCGKLVPSVAPVGMAKAGKLIEPVSGVQIVDGTPVAIPDGSVVLARY